MAFFTLAPDWVCAKARAEPFDAIELTLGALWADLTAPKP